MKTTYFLLCIITQLEMDNSSWSTSTSSIEIPLQNDIWFVTDTLYDHAYMVDELEEAENIRSGYYLNIRDSLSICMQHYDGRENPFYKVEKGAIEYLTRKSYNQSTYHQAGFCKSFAESTPHNYSPTFEKLFTQVFETPNKNNYGDNEPFDEMSGIFSLSDSSSANTTLSDLESSLPDTMDSVLNELSSMESDELARLIDGPSSKMPPCPDNAADKLFCYETLQPSSSSDSSKRTVSADSSVSTTESQQEISAATALCNFNKQTSYTDWIQTNRTISHPNNRTLSPSYLYDSAGNAIPLAVLENKTVPQMIQLLQRYQADCGCR